MKKIAQVTEVEVWDIDRLPEDERKLCLAAIEAVENAYAPYSNFLVGSAILLENETIVSGSNQENAVYPLGLCAERVAIFAAGHQFPNSKMLKIAVTTAATVAEDSFPPFPCGSCRQSILEQESRFDHPIKVLVISNKKEVYRMNSVKDILPFAFTKTFLNK